MKTMRIIITMLVLIAVPTADALAVTCICPGGGCISGRDTFPFCQECTAVCAGQSGPSSSPSSQPVDSKFLKDNFTVPIPGNVTGIGAGTAASAFGGAPMGSSGMVPYSIYDEEGPEKWHKRERMRFAKWLFYDYLDEERGQNQDASITWLLAAIKEDVFKSTVVEKYKSQGMSEDEALEQAYHDVMNDSNKYEKQGMSPDDAWDKAMNNLGISKNDK